MTVQGSPVRRIVAPTDLPETSLPGLLEAAALARVLGAELIVMTAVPPQRVAREEAQGEDLDRLLEATRLRLVAWFAARLPAAVRRELPVRFLAVVGPPAKAILQVAETEEADLIVLTSRRRPGWDRLVHETVVEEVVRAAPVPVVTVRGERSLAGTAPAA